MTERDTTRDDLVERVTDLVHAVKGGNFGMEWTRWNSQNQAEHIIALVRADERRRIREALEEAHDGFRCENTDGMGGRDQHSSGYLKGLEFAIGISTDEGEA